MKATVRIGVIEDMPTVLELIKELAVYEKAPDEVENTVSQLEEDGFGPRKIFDLFVAESEGRVVGFAMYYIKYSTWKGKCVYLEDLIVNEACRGKGIGALLFEAVAKKSKELAVKRMEWQVIDWNDPAINFYKKYDAVIDPEWYNCKFVYEQLQKF